MGKQLVDFGHLGYGRIVQLYVRGEPYIRRDPGRNHVEILEAVLDEFDIAFECGKDGYPLLKGDGYEVTGMGHFRLGPDDITYILDGRSATYRLGIDSKHIGAIKNLVPNIQFKIE